MPELENLKTVHRGEESATPCYLIVMLYSAENALSIIADTRARHQQQRHQQQRHRSSHQPRQPKPAGFVWFAVA